MGSDFYGSYWSPPGETRQKKEAVGNVVLAIEPLPVLTEALGWLTNYRRGKFSEKRVTMPIPKIQSLLLPVLRIVAGESGHDVEEIRSRLKYEFKLTHEQIEQTHAKSGINVFVNCVAWALAHLAMGKAIAPDRKGHYRTTERGVMLLDGNPLELTIRELH